MKRSRACQFAFCVLLASCPCAAAQETPQYGEPTARPSADIAVKQAEGAGSTEWENAPLWVLRTELSPGWLIGCRETELHFFQGLDGWGLGGPTRLGYMAEGGTRVVSRGETVAGEELAEPWLLAWFAGAEGWTNWDAPWLIVLQRRPTEVRLDEEGVCIRVAPEVAPEGAPTRGPRGVGEVLSMPLYGYYKPLQKGVDLLEKHGAKGRGVRTWEWARKLPADAVRRCRLWSRAARAFPMGCDETFSVDRARDRVTIRQRYTWRKTTDDWGTEPLRLAAVPPTLALARRGGTMPLTFEQEIEDLGVFTMYGPFEAAFDTDEVTYHLDVLQYVNETEVQQPPDERHPAARAAAEWVRTEMDKRFPDDSGKYQNDHMKENFCWAALSDGWYPKFLFLMRPETIPRAKKSLRNYFAEWFLQPERFHVDERDGKRYYVSFGPGVWDGKHLNTDAGKLGTAYVWTIWCYAHYADDWELIRERWELIRGLFTMHLTMKWKTVGREAIAELGDEAAPPLALARLAYRMGDLDLYNYACYLFARELVHHYVKQTGAEYFRQHQPVSSMEWMPEDVWLTNLWGGTAGWQIDGPAYPQETGERQYTNRYVRFSSEDVARFHRDVLAESTRRELDAYVASDQRHYKLDRDSPHIGPSLVRLRSVLLNEPADKLAQLTPPDQWKGMWGAPGLAMCWGYLRSSRLAPKYVRLIPKSGEASPFVPGLQRDLAKPNVVLVQSHWGEKGGFPLPTWMLWEPPKASPAHELKRPVWPFGHITPQSAAAPAKKEATALNWLTEVTWYELQ